VNKFTHVVLRRLNTWGVENVETRSTFFDGTLTQGLKYWVDEFLFYELSSTYCYHCLLGSNVSI
jgi:hypothetical protein